MRTNTIYLPKYSPFGLVLQEKKYLYSPAAAGAFISIPLTVKNFDGWISPTAISIGVIPSTKSSLSSRVRTVPAGHGLSPLFLTLNYQSPGTSVFGLLSLSTVEAPITFPEGSGS